MKTHIISKIKTLSIIKVSCSEHKALSLSPPIPDTITSDSHRAGIDKFMKASDAGKSSLPIFIDSHFFLAHESLWSRSRIVRQELNAAAHSEAFANCYRKTRIVERQVMSGFRFTSFDSLTSGMDIIRIIYKKKS